MKINWNKVLLRYCLFFTIYILVCLNAYAGDSTIFIGNTEYYISNTYKINKQTNIQIDTSNIGIINKTESINFNKKVAKNTNNRVSVPNQNKTIIENGCLDNSSC